MAATHPSVAPFDLFGPLGPAALRAVATGAGDWSVVVVREVSKILAAERKRRPETLARCVDELRSRDFISDEEAKDLKQIMAAFFNAIRGKTDGGVDHVTILDRYGRLCLDRNASPVAVAIASVAARNVVVPTAAPWTHEKFAAAIKITPGSTGAGALTGAVIGGAIGGAVGGAAGAGLGAMIGAAAGASVGLSNENLA
jgi:hypothetical protein